MFATIGAKKQEGGKPRYWLTISEKNQDDDGFTDASIMCRMSSEATDVFIDNMQDTKNDDVKIMKADIKEYWLKPAEIKKGERKGEKFVYVFINKIAVPKKNTKPSKREW